MKIITRINAMNNLQSHIGKNLSDVNKDLHLGVTIKKLDGGINKGWKGLVLEKLAGLNTNTKQAPNGLGFELKSLSYYIKNNKYIPRETMAITMVNKEDLDNKDFFNSHLWSKMKQLILCVVSWDGQHSTNSTLLLVKSLDLLDNDVLLCGMQQDYNLIRNNYLQNGYGSLHSKYGNYIQTRTKGAGHGSVSRAWYARKTLVNQICPPFSI